MKILLLGALILLTGCTNELEESLSSSETGTAADAAPETGSESDSPVDVAKPAPSFSVTDVDSTTAQGLIAGEAGLVILDIRTPEEFAAGHIDGAINIDFKSADFGSGLDALDKTKPCLMHCRSGGRSTAALPQFEERSFGKIYHLNEGFLAWGQK
jgi:phage shock protein E